MLTEVFVIHSKVCIKFYLFIYVFIDLFIYLSIRKYHLVLVYYGQKINTTIMKILNFK